MRTVLFVICAAISGVSAAKYMISVDNAGWGLSPNGITYSTVNQGWLMIGIVFGVLALGLLLEPFLSRKR